MFRLTHQQSAQLIEVARGAKPADLLLKNAEVVNVFTGELLRTHVAISGERIAGLGDYEAKEVIDLKGAILSPGFIDGHMHLESSMVTPEEFARAVVPRGTTTVVTDPHEISNVLGAKGIHYMLEASKGLPLDMMVMLSSCVPATHLENAGATITADEIAAWGEDERVLGLAEMMNFPGVVNGFPDCLRKIEAIGKGRADGHSPKLTGKGLAAYVAAGIESDHECTTHAEGTEKLRLGMYLMLREGSVTRDLEPLLPAVTQATARRCMFVTDDREPVDLLREGHIDFCIRKAIRLGCNPITAITMGSYNVAEYFGMRFRGAVAPGYYADLVVLEDLKGIRAMRVMKRGRWVAENGKPLWEARRADDSGTRGTVHLPKLSVDNLRIPAKGSHIQIIELIPGQIVTDRCVEAAKVVNGEAVADPARDIMKLAVIERHRATGNVGLGFVRGFGMQSGAIASTVAHDSHNLVVAGCNDEDMLVAARALAEVHGGLVVVNEGKILARLPMPVAGLMSDKSLEEVQGLNQDLIEATQSLGGKAPNPFMSLSFLALPVIPTLKLTDLGLVDVDKFDFVELFQSEGATISG